MSGVPGELVMSGELVVSGELVRACSLGDVETLYQLLNQQTDPASLVNLVSEGDVTLLMHTIIGAGKGEGDTIGAGKGGGHHRGREGGGGYLRGR